MEYNERQHAVYSKKLGSNNVTVSALSSLKIAIKSFFETYHIAQRYFPMGIDLKFPDLFSQDPEEQLCHHDAYQEKYIQTIFHFHHFFELFAKDILRLFDERLALKNNSIEVDVDIIMDVIKNNRVNPDSIFQNNTIEFKMAVSRVKKLKGSYSHPVSSIFERYDKTLTTIGNLRNRDYHRGLIIMRYTGFVQFIGQNILPLVRECLQNSHYKGLERYWKYDHGELNTDPIEEIISATINDPIDYSKVAFYQAIGVAGYNLKENKTTHETLYALFNDESRWQWEDYSRRRAKAFDHDHDIQVKSCLFCGIKSMSYMKKLIISQKMMVNISIFLVKLTRLSVRDVVYCYLVQILRTLMNMAYKKKTYG